MGTSGSTYLTEITPSGRNRGRVFDVFVSVSGAGFAIGPCIAALATPARWAPSLVPDGSLLARFPFALPFLLLGTLSLVTLILSIFCLPESHPRLVRTDAAAATRTDPLLNDDAASDDAGSGGGSSTGAEPPPGRRGDGERCGAAAVAEPSAPQRLCRAAACVAVSLYVTIAAQEIVYIQVFALWA